MRQIVAAIIERIGLEERVKRNYITWQTKSLAFFISGTSFDAKQAKRMTKVAESLSMEPEGESVEKEPGLGSYEKLRGFIG